MIERFQGVPSAAVLQEALSAQGIVRGDAAAAADLAEAGVLIEYAPGETLIAQGAADNDICFPCAGRVEIRVNDTRVAVRGGGQQVGEMALVDPGAVRAATVRALETTVALRVSERAFSIVANGRPQLWRLLAQELGSRLRERNLLVRQKNAVPVLFIGCSVEALPVARELQSALAHDSLEAKIWTDGIFVPSRFTIDDLERESKRADFAALLLSPDDRVFSREVESHGPRDNVVFELGLFMGAISRERTVVIQPRELALKVPTDLLGLRPIEYAAGRDLASAIGPAANELRKLVMSLGTR